MSNWFFLNGCSLLTPKNQQEASRLTIKRQTGENPRTDTNDLIAVLGVKGKQVKLGIHAPHIFTSSQ
ncbi:hypothetical protein ACJJI4_06725 [Microbulbifer sp. TRSA002]|uniref:hypothetical protein n=1 Tax=Microbulbifer sp. TRSA002 TaxID=3243382 RepID=UPI00403A62E8